MGKYLYCKYIFMRMFHWNVFVVSALSSSGIIRGWHLAFVIIFWFCNVSPLIFRMQITLYFTAVNLNIRKQTTTAFMRYTSVKQGTRRRVSRKPVGTPHHHHSERQLEWKRSFRNLFNHKLIYFLLLLNK